MCGSEPLRDVGSLVQKLRVLALHSDPEGEEAERHRGHPFTAPVGTLGMQGELADHVTQRRVDGFEHPVGPCQRVAVCGRVLDSDPPDGEVVAEQDTVRRGPGAALVAEKLHALDRGGEDLTLKIRQLMGFRSCLIASQRVRLRWREGRRKGQWLAIAST
jgi:hypothetical protein